MPSIRAGASFASSETMIRRKGASGTPESDPDQV